MILQLLLQWDMDSLNNNSNSRDSTIHMDTCSNPILTNHNHNNRINNNPQPHPLTSISIRYRKPHHPPNPCHSPLRSQTAMHRLVLLYPRHNSLH